MEKYITDERTGLKYVRNRAMEIVNTELIFT